MDDAFATIDVLNIITFSQQNVAWVDVPACLLLCIVFIAHVVDYEAGDVLTPR